MENSEQAASVTVAAIVSVFCLILIPVLFVLYLPILTVCAIFVNPRKEYSKDSPFYRFVLNCATATAIRLLRIRVHVSGAEKLPEGKVLFVCNHRSKFDPILTWYVFRKQKPAFVSKAENFKIPFFGRIIRKCCFMPIDRKNPRKAMTTILQAATLLKAQEVSIGIYPEGTRSPDCRLLPLHNGVFKIAQKAGAPIVVLSITGTEKIAKRTPFQATDVYLDVLEVFEYEKIRDTNTRLIGTAVHRLLETNTEKRDKQWQKDM